MPPKPQQRRAGYNGGYADALMAILSEITGDQADAIPNGDHDSGT